MTILDIVSYGWKDSTTLGCVLSICLWCLSFSRSKKSKKIIEEEKKKRVEKQSVICWVLASILLGVALYDLWFLPIPQHGPENQWADIVPSQNKNKNIHSFCGYFNLL